MAAKRHVWRPRTGRPVDRYGTTERVRRVLPVPGGMPVGIASVTSLRYSAVPSLPTIVTPSAKPSLVSVTLLADAPPAWSRGVAPTIMSVHNVTVRAMPTDAMTGVRF
jgi:hypothetical protein